MSLLSRQLTLAQETFLTRYPSCWLVWEPGEWSVPVSGVDVSVAETRLPTNEVTELRPLGGDALCFALKVAEGTTVQVGRAADNEIVVSDMTVSRLHARLEFNQGAWTITPLSETKKTMVAGKAAGTGKAHALHSAQVVELGGVKVTFYDATAFKARVATSGVKTKR